MAYRNATIATAVLLMGLFFAGAASGQTPEPASPVDAFQTLMQTGRTLYDRQHYDEAEAAFEKAVKLRSKEAAARYWLGMTYYKQQNYKDAVKAFKQAIRHDRTSADAYIGLGLTYMNMKNRMVEARQTLKDALKVDPDNDQVYYLLGVSYIEQSKRDMMAPLYIMQGRQAFQQATVLNPNHPDAAYQLGLTYEYPSRDYPRAMSMYYRQLLATPGHRDALEHLGKCAFATGQYLEGVDLLKQLISVYGSDTVHPRVHSLVAQLQASHLQAEKQYAQALKIYSEYLDLLDPEEKALYTDLRYVASEKEYETYRQAPDADKPAIWKKFWASRDPDPATEVNERLVEHYRRVMYARENFSRSQYPWDRRGEIYIRYGEPDDRQHFLVRAGEDARENMKPTGNARIDAIRERNHKLRYRLKVDNAGIRPFGVGDALEAAMELPDGRGLVPETGRGADQFRLQASRETQALAFVSESWVYVEHDMELYFVDQLGLGKFDYPLLSHDVNMDAIRREITYHPQIVAERLIKKTPESYRFDYGGEPLDFRFDAVTFKGQEGQTLLEVSYGVPLRQLGDATDGQGLKTWFDSHVVLRDDDFNRIAAVSERIGPIERPLQKRSKNAVGVDLRTASMSLEAPPGDYRSAVEVRDEASRRIGIFQMPMTVTDYTGDSLMVSGIKIASAITPTDEEGAFVRNGLRIDPNPSHIFPQDAPVYFYYEIYNLSTDETGRTSYRTELEITPKERPMNIVWRILSGFGKLVKRTDTDQSVLLIYEDEGPAGDTHRFTSIDTQDSPAGVYALRLTVTDQNTGQTASRTTEFVVAEAQNASSP